VWVEHKLQTPRKIALKGCPQNGEIIANAPATKFLNDRYRSKEEHRRGKNVVRDFNLGAVHALTSRLI
jgi:hypothetical protein